MTSPPLRIFIVEDHASTLSLLQRYLHGLGHEVQTAGDIASALAQLAEMETDLLISDLGLPDGDGWELMRRLNPHGRFMAVAMSGFGSEEDTARSAAAGYRHHLVKPFLPEELDAILEEACQFAAAKRRGT